VLLVQVKGAHGDPTLWTAELTHLVDTFLQRHLPPQQGRRHWADQAAARVGANDGGPKAPR
jgi:hypothetical protein